MGFYLRCNRLSNAVGSMLHIEAQPIPDREENRKGEEGKRRYKRWFHIRLSDKCPSQQFANDVGTNSHLWPVGTIIQQYESYWIFREGWEKKAKMRTRTIQAGSQIFHLSLSESSWVRNLRMAIGFSVCTVFGRTANRIDELSVYINFSVCSDGLNYSVEVFRDRSLFLWPMSEYKPQSTYWTPFCQERETYVRFIVKSILRWGSAHCLYWLK